MRARRGRPAAVLVAALLTAGLPLTADPAGAATSRPVEDACPAGLLPESTFTDTEGLPEGIVLAIDCILGWAVTQGTSAETFSPADPVVRGQMATFLVNTLANTTGWEAPEDAENAFTDDDGTTHETNINVVAAEGIAKGTGLDSFSPSARVTRGQMATFVVGTLRRVLGSVPPATEDHFGDDNGTTHEASINALADLGIVAGTSSGGYEPAAPVLRRQMALFLARSLDLLVERGKAEPPFPLVAVRGDPETLEFHEARSCTVGSLAGAKVQLMLFLPGDVNEAEEGGLLFPDLDENGLADEPAVIVPDIASVDGTAQDPDTKSVDDVSSDGTVEVVLSAVDEGDAVLVAFLDEGKTPHALDLDATGAPAESVAVGCQSAWIPPEAILGTHPEVTVDSVNAAAEAPYFTGTPLGQSPATFYYDGDDTYEGKAADSGSFAALLSRGDKLNAQYATDPAGTSNFEVTLDTVAPPGTPTAKAANVDEGTTLNDIVVAFPVPPHNGAGTQYRVERAKTHGEPGACDETFASSVLSVGTVDASPFIEENVAEGCYVYRVWAISSAGTTKQSGFSNMVGSGLPDEADTVRPLSEFAGVEHADPPESLGDGDVIQIRFSERMAEPGTGESAASITVRSEGTNVTLTNGGNAEFALNVGPETVGGVERPRGWVLTVTVTSTPAPTIAWPAEIISHSGVTDVAGNLWDVGGSPDRTLEAP